MYRWSYALFLVGIFSVTMELGRASLDRFIRKKEWFKVKKVYVKGLQSVLPEEVVQQIPTTIMNFIVSIDKNLLQSYVERHPRILLQSVQTKLPDTLYLDVQEKKTTFLLNVGEKYWELDKLGESISSGNTLSDVRNPNALILLASQEIGAGSTAQLISRICDVLQKIPEEERDFLDCISVMDFRDEWDPKMILIDPYLKIYVDPIFDLDQYRKTRYAYVYAKNLEKHPKVVDIRGKSVRYSF